MNLILQMKTKEVGGGNQISTIPNSFNIIVKKGSYNMSNFSTWMIAIFMVMFWLFRAVVAVCTQYSIDLLGITAYNLTFEIIIALQVEIQFQKYK